MTVTTKNINSKFFLINRSELEGRFDPDMVLYNRLTKSYNYPTIKLKNLLIKNPQYGANESGIERKNNKEPRYIRITDIDEYGLLKDKIGVSAENIEQKYFLNNNDILFARSGATVGKAYIHRKNNFDYECFFAGYMIRFCVDNSKILADYLFTYTQLNIYKEWVNAIQRAAGQPNINAEEYKSLIIALPPINIQHQIVEKINNAYIQKQQKESQAKELLKSIDTYLLNELGITLPEKDKSIGSRMFTVNFSEIVGNRLDPDYTSKYEYLINQKANFEFVNLGSLIVKSPQYGANEEASEPKTIEDVRYIRITDIDEYGFLKTSKWKTANTINKNYSLKYNDILFARSGSVGRCYIHKELNQEAIFAGYLIRFIIDENKALPDYIFNFCNSSIYKFWVSAIERPAVQSNINSEEFKSLPIPLPSLQKQQEIVNHINDIQEQIKTLQTDAKRILDDAKQEVEEIIIGN